MSVGVSLLLHFAFCVQFVYILCHGLLFTFSSITARTLFVNKSKIPVASKSLMCLLMAIGCHYWNAVCASNARTKQKRASFSHQGECKHFIQFSLSCRCGTHWAFFAFISIDCFSFAIMWNLFCNSIHFSPKITLPNRTVLIDRSKFAPKMWCFAFLTTISDHICRCLLFDAIYCAIAV